jgi:hypothetical protein
MRKHSIGNRDLELRVLEKEEGVEERGPCQSLPSRAAPGSGTSIIAKFVITCVK